MSPPVLATPRHSPTRPWSTISSRTARTRRARRRKPTDRLRRLEAPEKSGAFFHWRPLRANNMHIDDQWLCVKNGDFTIRRQSGGNGMASTKVYELARDLWPVLVKQSGLDASDRAPRFWRRDPEE